MTLPESPSALLAADRRARNAAQTQFDRHLALEAAEQGADYVAFGAFYPTSTKTTKSEAPIEILEWWSELMVVPVVAIGGITAGNCAPLVRAGADFLAVVSAVWDHPEGPAAAVRALNESIAKAR